MFFSISDAPPTSQKRKKKATKLGPSKQTSTKLARKKAASAHGGFSAGPSPLQNMVGMKGEDGCPYCFLLPCITETCRNAGWVGPGQAPCDENAGLRHERYSRFWKTMDNLQAWTIERYIQRKRQIGAGIPGVVYHQREVMPECVVSFVRNK